MSSTQLPTLLLVHGAWHGGWYWEQKTAPWLREKGLRVETMDLPGHGVAGPERIGWYSISDYVDAVERKIASIGGPVVVGGHSMGGFVVQKLMERKPAQLAGAILIAAATPRGVMGVIRNLLTKHPLDFLVANATVDLYHLARTPERARDLFYSNKLPETELREYHGRISNESYRAFLDMMGLAAPKAKKADPALPKLVIGGTKDTIFPTEIVERTAKAYGVKAVMFDELPHSMNLDVGHEKVSACIFDWIEKLPLAA